MSIFNKEIKQYIEHEIKLRLHDEMFKITSDKFKSLEDAIRHLDN